MDGIGRLTKAEKLERDARAQYWMNQRKIERVAEGAYRGGWNYMTGELVEELIKGGNSKLDDDNELVLIIEGNGEYRLYAYNFEQDTYTARKILTYKEEETVGSNA